jgi:hypothetical protein
MTTIKIIQHKTCGETFTAEINEDDAIVAMSIPMPHEIYDAGDGYQDLEPLDDPIEMDAYRVINESPNIG